jgi:predicted DNA-binding transcriptional regulator YafY
MASSRTTAMTERISKVRDYIITNPNSTQEDLMKDLHIKQDSLYSILLGLKDDQNICQDSSYNLSLNGKKLSVQQLEDYSDQKSNNQGTPIPERLLYLYHHLYEAIPYGGLSWSELLRKYTHLLEQSGSPLPKKASISRNLQRDLKRLELYSIRLERPETGSEKYCLAQSYLPKLSPENAAVLYVSTLLYRNTLLSTAIDTVREKMEGNYYKGLLDRSKILQERIYVLGDTLANPEQFGTVLANLIRAVSESIPVKLTYLNNDGEESERLLEPVGLVCKRQVWYLIGRQPEDGEFRTFRVDQIHYLILRDSERFNYPEDFSLTDHIGASWGVFCNDEIKRVVLKFSKRVAHRVQNLRYHPTQRVIDVEEDGSVLIQFDACGLIELQTWIMQWGSQVEVLEPGFLREQVKKAASEIAQIY